MSDDKPDFSGIYTPPSTVNATGPRGNLIFNADKMAPIKPGAEGLLYELRNGDPRHDEPRAMCLPAGFPSGMLYILPIQIVQNPKSIVIIPNVASASVMLWPIVKAVTRISTFFQSTTEYNIPSIAMIAGERCDEDQYTTRVCGRILRNCR